MRLVPAIKGGGPGLRDGSRDQFGQVGLGEPSFPEGNAHGNE